MLKPDYPAFVCLAFSHNFITGCMNKLRISIMRKMKEEVYLGMSGDTRFTQATPVIF
jgi:hypothetical protein